MKKIVISLSLIISCLLGFDIKMSHEFSTFISPTKLAVHVNINTIKKSSSEVLTALSMYSDFIKSYKELTIKGGDFNTAVSYKYVNKKRVKVGYRGNISYRIKSSSPEDLTAFVSALSSKSGSDKDVELSVSSSSWQVKKEDLQKAKDELRMKAIKWATEYKDELSSKMGLECSVKSIDFDKINYVRPQVMYDSRMIESKSAPTMPVPQKDSRDLKINPRFEFDCR